MQALASNNHCDILVMGGGPAGSTAAALLAQKGFDVVLLEKAHHPRFHIGESLLPANLPLLEKLGVNEAVKKIGMEKWGAEFVSPWHENQKQTYQFAEAWDKSMPYAYQVRRSEFDDILIKNAAQKGATVLEGTQVKQVEFLPKQQGATVLAKNAQGENLNWQARFVLDATGRDTLLANQLKLKIKNEKHNSTALYGHFAGAMRNPGQAEGNITIYWFDHGWFWFIPLADGLTSIGAVTWPYYLKTRNGKPLAEFFKDTIALCPLLAKRLEHATLASEVEATGNYSYSSTRSYGENYLLLGDAFTFIDPVFSSGVMLAMNSAFMAADTVEVCLNTPQHSSQALKKFDTVMRKGPAEFSWFIYRVTNPMMRDLMMGPRNFFRIKDSLLSVLAGDVFSNPHIWRGVRLFKGIYYIGSLINFKRTMMALKKRKNNIQPV